MSILFEYPTIALVIVYIGKWRSYLHLHLKSFIPHLMSITPHLFNPLVEFISAWVPMHLIPYKSYCKQTGPELPPLNSEDPNSSYENFKDPFLLLSSSKQ